MTKLGEFIENVTGKAKSEYKSRRDGLTGRLKAALKVPGYAGALTAALQKAEAAAGKKRYTEATAAMDELERLVGLAESLPSDPMKAMAVGSRLEAAWLPARGLPAVDPGLTKAREKIVAAMKEERYDDADKDIVLLDGFVKAAVADHAEYTEASLALDGHLDGLDLFAAPEAAGLRSDRTGGDGQAQVGDYGGAKMILAKLAGDAADLLTKYQQAQKDWEGKLGVRKTVGGKVAALKEWKIDGADALQVRLDATVNLAEMQKRHAQAVIDLDGVHTDVENLHTAESNKRKDKKQKEQQEASDELDEKGSGLPELFAKEDYEKAESVQKPRVEEAEKRCGPVPDLAEALKPVTEGWAKVGEQVKAGNYLEANNLLGGLVTKIDDALKAADEAEKREGELKQKVAEFKLRTDKAPNPASTPETGTHWKAATDKMGEVNDHLSKREVKLAGEDFALLGPTVEAAENKQKEFDDAKLDAINKRKALANYDEATKVVATPPAGDMLKAQILEFQDKETIVTDAETANKLADALKGHAELTKAAKGLVEAHGSWKLYDAAFTPEIRQNDQKADVIYNQNPADLKTERQAYVGKWNDWDNAVKKAKVDGKWGPVQATVAPLGVAAKALVDVHTLWAAYQKLLTKAFGKELVKAFEIRKKASPDLTAEGNEVLAKYNIWDPHQKNKRWKDAADAVPPLQTACQNLIAAEKNLTDAFNVAYAGKAKADIDRAIKVKGINLEVLAKETKTFWTLCDPWLKDWKASKWTAATNAVAAVAVAAAEYLKAFDKHDKENKDFQANSLDGLAHYKEAVKICIDGKVPATEYLPAPVRAFRLNYFLMEAARGKADWAEATRLLTPLGTAAAEVDPAFKGWNTYGNKSVVMMPLMEKARLAAASAPAGLKVQKEAFEAEANKIGPAVTGKNWGAALNALNAAETLAKTLITAFENFAKLRKPFDDAVKDATPKAEEARAIVKNLPTALKTNDKVVAFTDAEKAVTDAENDSKWTDGKNAAVTLKAKANDLVNAAGTLNSAFTEADKNDFKQKLKALDPRVKKADESWLMSSHITKLQEDVKAGKLRVENAVGVAQDYLDAGVKYEQLVAALDKMEAAKTAYEEFEKKFQTAESGPVKAARELGDDPADLAKARDERLDAKKNRITEVAGHGQITLATSLVATWAEEAAAWKDKWAEAQEAHAALKNPPPDEAKLKALADAPGGGKVLDDMIAALPSDSTNVSVYAAAMKVRYGVEMKQFETQQDEFKDLKAVPDAPDADKSVRKMYKMLATVPDTHVKGPLRELIRYTKDTDGGDYGELLQKAQLYCGRVHELGNDGKVLREPLVKPEHLPEVDDDCKPVDDVNPNQFGFTALHEVGHAIDDAAGFMAQRRGDSKFGGWLTSSPEDAAAAAAAHFGYDKDYLAKVLKNKGKPIPDDRPGKPSGKTTAAWAKAQTDAEAWCAKVVEGYGLWWRGAEIDGVAIGGRVYQQAYSSLWYSYPASARKQGITGYQFRSPAEWFAELYAAYYTRKLKEVHPAVSWLKDLKAPSA